MPDLWPDDFGTFTVTPPIVILQEQAELLGKKTKGLVTGNVRSRGSGKEFAHEFFLVAPSLENYRYHLFSLTHPVHLYPARIFWQLDSPVITKECDTEESLLSALRSLFGSEETKRVIQAIKAQAETAVA